MVLRRPRPTNKSLCDPLAGSSPAKELGKGGGGKAVRRDRGEKGEHGQALAEVDVRDLLREATVPTGCRPLVLLRLAIREEEGKLECLRQGDELELRRGRERLRDVPTVEGLDGSACTPSLEPSRTHVPMPVNSL